MINKCPTARKLTAGLELFTGAYAFVADLRVDAREEAVALLIAAIVVVETAGIGAAQRIAEDFFVPGLFDLRRIHTHLAIILQKLYTDIDAFVTDVSRVPFEETRHFTVGEPAK